VAADDLGDVGGGELGVAGIFAFGGIDDEDLGADFEADGFDPSDDFFLGGARIRGAFEAEDLARAEMRHYGSKGVGHEAEIGLEVFVERRGDAEDDCVAVLDAGEVGCGIEFAPARASATEAVGMCLM
jgi:hypothetical protein